MGTGEIGNRNHGWGGKLGGGKCVGGFDGRDGWDGRNNVIPQLAVAGALAGFLPRARSAGKRQGFQLLYNEWHGPHLS